MPDKKVPKWYDMRLCDMSLEEYQRFTHHAIQQGNGPIMATIRLHCLMCGQAMMVSYMTGNEETIGEIIERVIVSQSTKPVFLCPNCQKDEVPK